MQTLKQLRPCQVKEVRDKLIQRQGGLCAICGKPFTKRDPAVLDHCHITGIIRDAIHRSCNGAEGRVRARAHLGHAGVSSTEYLIALGKYLERHFVNPRHLLHPSWKRR